RQRRLRFRCNSIPVGGAIMPVSLYTIRVPTDYPDLQSAFVVATKAPALRVNIVIDSGHQPASGITCANGDFSHIWIQSQSGTVTLPAYFSGSFLSGSNCGMPVLDCLVDMGAAQASGVGLHGYSAVRASRGYIPAGRGVMNATEIG